MIHFNVIFNHMYKFLITTQLYDPANNSMYFYYTDGNIIRRKLLNVMSITNHSHTIHIEYYQINTVYN